MDPYPPPPSPYEQVPAPRQGAKAWQVIMAAALGAFFGSVLVCGGGVALTMTYFQQQISTLGGLGGMNGNFGVVPNLNYTMQLPATVVQNQPFEIELTLENTGSSAMTIHSLQDYSSLTFQQSDPPWQANNYGELIYQMTLQPNQPQTIKLTATTSEIGDLFINIDANLDANGTNYAEAYSSITVNPAPANTPSSSTSP